MNVMVRNMVLAGLVLAAMPAAADPSVDVTQGLRFGPVFARDNDSVHGIRIATDGQMTQVGTGLISTDNGATARQGIFALTGFTPGDNVSISFDPAQVQVSCVCPGGASFTVDSFEISPPSIVIDGSGEQIVSFGATVKTDGSGLRYTSATYNGTVAVSFTIDNL